MTAQSSAQQAVQASSSAAQAWWRGAVIYQIYPRSFQDTNGDGVGDLAGITDRLPYVAELGVDAIWLCPFFTSPMRDMGYDVADYCDVDPVFGTLDDFNTLIARAHSLGLKVMIDQVLSHTSSDHPWFGESKSDQNSARSDWYVWADARPDGTPPNNWQSIFGGPAWTWNAKRCQYYFHNFLSTQPDLNLHNPAVQDALLESIQFWLDLGVDGFRLDTVNYFFHDAELRDNPPVSERGSNDVPEINPYGFQEHIFDKTRPENVAFLKRIRSLLDSYPGSATVGEVGDGSRSLQTMAQYTADGDRLHMCYSFDMLSESFSSKHFYDCVTDFEEASRKYSGGTSWPCWAFSNHDVVRHMSRWLESADDHDRLAKLAASLLLSLKGSVCLYQGEELGLSEAELEFEDLTDPYGITFWPEFKGRDGCRTPMVWDSGEPNGGFSSAKKTWLPVTAPHIEVAANTQSGNPDSILEHYRSFLAFRKSQPSLISGDITFLPSVDQALAFMRSDGKDAVLCVFNLASESIRFEMPESVTAQGIPVRGFRSMFDGKSVTLDGFQAFFASVPG